MKYIITESRLEEAITEYFNTTFDVSNINWSYPYTYNDETGEEGEDENAIDFYLGDYDSFETNYIFHWFDKQHYVYPDASTLSKALYDIAPIVEISQPYVRTFDGYFGDKWKEPFKKWFTKNFNLSVKTINTNGMKSFDDSVF